MSERVVAGPGCASHSMHFRRWHAYLQMSLILFLSLAAMMCEMSDLSSKAKGRCQARNERGVMYATTIDRNPFDGVTSEEFARRILGLLVL